LTYDVIQVHQVVSGDFMAKNLLKPLDSFIAKDTAEVNPNDFSAYALNATKWQGKTYGLPDNMSLWAIWYNADLFTKYGVKTPTEWAKEGKWTWDQFLQTAREMTRGQGENKTWGLGSIWGGYSPALGFWGWVYYLPVVWSYGGDMWNKEVTAFALDTKEAVEGLQYFADLILKHQVAPPVDQGPQWDPKPGKVAMGYFGHFHVPLYKEAAWKISMVNVPSGRAGLFSPGGFSMMSMFREAKNEEAAWLWCKWFTLDGQKAFLDAGVYTAPTRKSLANYPGWVKNRQPWEDLQVWAKATETFRTPQAVPGWVKIINDNWAKQYDQVLAGKITLQEAVAAAKKAIDAILKQELGL
jgi:multiple sugar transport system substrate-binding protein